MSAPTRKARQEYAAKLSALRARLGSSATEPNPESLSRSYGLPVPDVERVIEEMKHG